jgi:16S rRNA (guanine527-N7)-methyltransferase
LPELDLNVSRETFRRLSLFADLLLKWTDKINLIGPRERGLLWERHIGDSLRLAAFIPTTGSIVDLGSGAGFPGLILAIALSRHVTLVESDQRKASFLREAARTTEAPVTVVARRIEASGLIGMDIITARALAPLPRLLDLAAPILGPQGVCLLLKGTGVETELTDARREWQMTVHRHVDPATHEGCILEVKHLRRIQPKAG